MTAVVEVSAPHSVPIIATQGVLRRLLAGRMGAVGLACCWWPWSWPSSRPLLAPYDPYATVRVTISRHLPGALGSAPAGDR